MTSALQHSSPLKIGILCYPTYGGSGVVATEIGMEMAKRGHCIHFISYDVPVRLNRFSENIYFHEVKVRDNPLFTYPPYSLALASKIVEVATYEKLDLIHAHYAIPHATSAYLAKQILGTSLPKVITTLHGTDITLVGKDCSYLPIARFSITNSDAITTPSHFLKQATFDKLNIPIDTHIKVIPNFVNTDEYTPIAPNDRVNLEHLFGKCANKGSVLTHISNFRPVKKVSDVVHVFQKILREHSCHLILVGDGPERSKVEQLVRDLNLSEHVCFLGKQASIAEILQSSDLFLLPSENESFGLAALEALSCAVPVIASNAEGIPELITHGETGYLSNIGDTEDMASNALKLLTDKDHYNTMAKAARKRAVEQFQRKSLIARYEEYYYEVLSSE